MSNMKFNVPHGTLTIDIHEKDGIRSIQIVYDDFVFTLSRAEIIGKSREELLQEIEWKLKKTKEHRETFARIIDSVAKSNDKSEYEKLMERLKEVDPELCKLCGIFTD